MGKARRVGSNKTDRASGKSVTRRPQKTYTFSRRVVFSGMNRSTPPASIHTTDTRVYRNCSRHGGVTTTTLRNGACKTGGHPCTIRTNAGTEKMMESTYPAQNKSLTSGRST